MAEGVPYLLTGRCHRRKDAFSCQKGVSAGGRDAVTVYNGAIVGKQGAFLYQKSAFAGGKAPINGFGAKIDPELRYPANGDED